TCQTERARPRNRTDRPSQAQRCAPLLIELDQLEFTPGAEALLGDRLAQARVLAPDADQPRPAPDPRVRHPRILTIPARCPGADGAEVDMPVVGAGRAEFEDEIDALAARSGDVALASGDAVPELGAFPRKVARRRLGRFEMPGRLLQGRKRVGGSAVHLGDA